MSWRLLGGGPRGDVCLQLALVFFECMLVHVWLWVSQCVWVWLVECVCVCVCARVCARLWAGLGLHVSSRARQEKLEGQPHHKKENMRVPSRYDAHLYDWDLDLEIRSGSLPLADWLVGDNIDWRTFKLNGYEPKKGRNYEDILWMVRKQGQTFHQSNLIGVLPAWVKPSAGFFQGNTCEVGTFF